MPSGYRFSAKTFLHCLVPALILIWAGSAWAGSGIFPTQKVGWDLDSQLEDRLIDLGVLPESTVMVVTTAVNLGDLKTASSLSRYASEELAMWFVQNGYRVREIRRAADIDMVPETGEIILTREESRLLTDKANVSLVLTGTYSVMPDRVDFHFRILEAAGNEVLAIAKAGVPMSAGVYGMLTREERVAAKVVRPTVETKPD
ncbi:MAG: hypothetical protein EOM25_10785 [Deltaproteobacteria bacterium]|nr:hypothetical protein [Deltaproteobacteria bacterium]